MFRRRYQECLLVEISQCNFVECALEMRSFKHLTGAMLTTLLTPEQWKNEQTKNAFVKNKTNERTKKEQASRKKKKHEAENKIINYVVPV